MNQPILRLKRAPRAAIVPLVTGEFWLVWRVGSDRISKRHTTVELAETEAKRLAGQFPDRTFYVLHACAAFGKAEA
jgi:hypothetical protein